MGERGVASGRMVADRYARQRKELIGVATVLGLIGIAQSQLIGFFIS